MQDNINQATHIHPKKDVFYKIEKRNDKSLFQLLMCLAYKLWFWCDYQKKWVRGYCQPHISELIKVSFGEL